MVDNFSPPKKLYPYVCTYIHTWNNGKMKGAIWENVVLQHLTSTT